MAHAYTPGLKVLENTSVEKERRLPLKGEVLVEKGIDVTKVSDITEYPEILWRNFLIQ